jgi:hypothetical protein
MAAANAYLACAIVQTEKEELLLKGHRALCLRCHLRLDARSTRVRSQARRMLETIAFTSCWTWVTVPPQGTLSSVREKGPQFRNIVFHGRESRIDRPEKNHAFETKPANDRFIFDFLATIHAFRRVLLFRC